MFWITEDPSSGRLVQHLAKNYKNGSIVSVGMDKVSVMAAYSDPLCMCIGRQSAFLYSELHTHTHTHTQRSQYAAITLTLSMPTDTIEPFL